MLLSQCYHVSNVGWKCFGYVLERFWKGCGHYFNKLVKVEAWVQGCGTNNCLCNWKTFADTIRYLSTPRRRWRILWRYLTTEHDEEGPLSREPSSLWGLRGTMNDERRTSMEEYMYCYTYLIYDSYIHIYKYIYVSLSLHVVFVFFKNGCQWVTPNNKCKYKDMNTEP